MVCVAVPKDTVWPIEPHTSAKHQILRKYLDAWLPILGKYNNRIVYIDGFAGPGEYADGEPGSPIIALQAASAHRAKFGGELVFWFIEERQDRVEHLKNRIATLQLPPNCTVRPEEGTFAEKLTALLNALDAGGGKIAPTFALIDPFGFAGIPYMLVKRLLEKNRCEVLVTFMVDSINRWLTHPDDAIRAHITETFGTDEAVRMWRPSCMITQHTSASIWAKSSSNSKRVDSCQSRRTKLMERNGAPGASPMRLWSPSHKDFSLRRERHFDGAQSTP
jgi:three-Cys-motif partner protein